jgi:hypothetical protein
MGIHGALRYPHVDWVGALPGAKTCEPWEKPCESQNPQSPSSSGKLIDMHHITVITLITVTCDALSHLVIVTLP